MTDKKGFDLLHSFVPGPLTGQYNVKFPLIIEGKMTTHLHPIDGLPVQETPICDEQIEIYRDAVDTNFEHRALPEHCAEDLEREKRLAEKQLAVAVTLLNQIKSGDCTYYEIWNEGLLTQESYHDKIPKILAEIKAIGESK